MDCSIYTNIFQTPSVCMTMADSLLIAAPFFMFFVLLMVIKKKK